MDMHGKDDFPNFDAAKTDTEPVPWHSGASHFMNIGIPAICMPRSQMATLVPSSTKWHSSRRGHTMCPPNPSQSVTDLLTAYQPVTRDGLAGRFQRYASRTSERTGASSGAGLTLTPVS